MGTDIVVSSCSSSSLCLSPAYLGRVDITLHLLVCYSQQPPRGAFGPTPCLRLTGLLPQGVAQGVLAPFPAPGVLERHDTYAIQSVCMAGHCGLCKN